MCFRRSRWAWLILAVLQVLGGGASCQVGAPMREEQKCPVPEFKVQGDLVKEIRLLYEEEYAETARDKQIALGKKLLELAEESADPTRFVFLIEANAIAMTQCDLETSFRICDELSQYEGRLFNLHVLRELALRAALRQEVERKMLRDNQLQQACIALCRSSGWEAIQDDETEIGRNLFRSAAVLADLMGQGEGVSKELKDQLKREASDLAQIHIDMANWKRRSQAPAGSRDEAAIQLEGGTIRCLGQNRWEDGLPLLAGGNDEELAAAAKADLAQRAEADYLANGDRWWALSERFQGLKRQNLRDRASFCYEQALVGLEDEVARNRVHKRVKEALAAVRMAPDSYSRQPPQLNHQREFSAKDKTPIRMLAADDGICFLTAIVGPWNANGELGIAIDRDGDYTLVSRGRQPLIGRAMALTELRWRTEFQPQISEVSWSGGAAVKLLDKSDGFAVLSFVGGGLNKDSEAGITLSEEGEWYLGGKGSVSAKALVVKSNRRGAFNAFVREHGWEVGRSATELLRRDLGFCFLSWIGGAIETGEEVQVFLDGDYWRLSGRAAQRSLRARAITVRTKKFAEDE